MIQTKYTIKLNIQLQLKTKIKLKLLIFIACHSDKIHFSTSPISAFWKYVVLLICGR